MPVPAFPLPPPPARTGPAVTPEVALKWTGLGLLFLAAAFVVSTAITRGWIGPELQLAGAVAIGVAMITAGLRPIKAIEGWTLSLVSVGLGVLFTSAGASYDWLDLVGSGTALIGAGLVGVAGVALSRHLDREVVAGVTLGGWIILFVWLEGADRGSFTIAGLTLLVVLVFFGLHLERGWSLLFASTLVISAFFFLAAAGNGSKIDVDLGSTVAPVQIAIALGALAYWLTPWLRIERERIDPAAEPDHIAVRVTGRLLLGVPLWFWGTVAVLHDVDGDALAPLAFALAGLAALIAIGLASRIPRWLWATQLLGASVLVSVGLATWLEGTVLLAAFALQALAMLALSDVVKDEWFTRQSVLTAAIVLMATGVLTTRAVEVDATPGDDAIHLAIFAITAAVAYWIRHRTEAKLLALASYVGAMLWILSVFIHLPQGQFIISSIWAAIGVAVVVFALGRKHVDAGRVGLATLLVVVTKLLTVDLAEIDTFWRAGLFFVIGLGFLWLSTRIPGLLGSQNPGTDRGGSDGGETVGGGTGHNGDDGLGFPPGPPQMQPPDPPPNPGSGVPQV